MSLSCVCYDDCDADWYYSPDDFFKPYAGKRSTRCRSCQVLIKPGDQALEFTRTRCPRTEIEERIYGDGDTIPLASWFHCESCGEIYLNLSELKYCLYVEDDMRDNLKEYHKLTGFIPEEQL